MVERIFADMPRCHAIEIYRNYRRVWTVTEPESLGIHCFFLSAFVVSYYEASALALRNSSWWA